jgi:hypothetical protein
MCIHATMKLIEPIFELIFAVQIMIVIEPNFLHLPNFTQTVGDTTYNRGHTFLIKI